MKERVHNGENSIEYLSTNSIIIYPLTKGLSSKIFFEYIIHMVAVIIWGYYGSVGVYILLFYIVFWTHLFSRIFFAEIKIQFIFTLLYCIMFHLSLRIKFLCYASIIDLYMWVGSIDICDYYVKSDGNHFNLILIWPMD